MCGHCVQRVARCPHAVRSSKYTHPRTKRCATIVSNASRAAHTQRAHQNTLARARLLAAQNTIFSYVYWQNYSLLLGGYSLNDSTCLLASESVYVVLGFKGPSASASASACTCVRASQVMLRAWTWAHGFQLAAAGGASEGKPTRGLPLAAVKGKLAHKRTLGRHGHVHQRCARVKGVGSNVRE
jgi:hypothetical protein